MSTLLSTFMRTPHRLQIYAIIIKAILPVYGEIRAGQPSHYEIEHRH